MLAVLLVGAISTGLWWFWPEPTGASGNQRTEEVTPVTLNLQDPSPARTAQRAVQELGGSRPADTIAASPESRPIVPAAATNPPPVELRQTLNNRTAPGRTGGAVPDPRLASATPSPTTTAPGPASIPVNRAPGAGEAATKSPVSQPRQTTPPVDAAPAANPGTGSAASDSLVARFMMQADQAQSANRPVDARIALNRALHSPGATAAERQALRARIADLNSRLVFSAVVTPGDPMVETYSVQSGDRIAKIVDNHDLGVDWRLVQRVNGISDPSRIRIGQKLKLVRGPFHAVVYKTEYRLDLYADVRDPDGNRLYIRSFSVGLGEHNSTPTGKFVVKSGSKLIDPHWVNPRTGERFSNVDPKNPIGERWIGIEGAEPATQTLSGYGLHGTIEPQSIGQDASMGCVRMLPEDVELVYEMLGERVSTVEIRP